MTDTGMKEKTTRFFRVGQLEGADELVPQQFDWRGLYSAMESGEDAPAQVEIDEHWYTQLDDHFAIGMHKILDTDFMTRFSAKAKRVVDLADQESDDGPLAHSSVILPLGDGPYFTLTLGGRGSPAASRLVNLLNATWPLSGNRKWRISPVMDQSKLADLAQSTGATELQTKFTTQRTIFEQIDDGSGPLEYADHLALQIGADIEIELNIKLLKSERSRLAPKQSLKDMILEGSRVLAGPNSKAKARLMDPDGRSRLVNLVESQLAAESEVPLTGSSTRFSDLCTALYGQRDELRAILEATLGGADGTGS